ncbi:NimA-related protein kinase 6 [Volvox carteri f. nagariensis]|uniref:non-specific serine/threonine protein kinase n=1 Tax=Volvox carteri f. nagariensis TaxID=3068 RepID=D8TNS7_VOLCA|nr:NimA-related protein kinase 6 [Volvox carteri f. nagariensis]EFJ50892.1 NimA-related protein kinase 6 [Volvox carteri f. nagariensis]|eukprot:XP_002947904.1 NimA-related protein kinase 6 [Volvox carteri f. nagariensis]
MSRPPSEGQPAAVGPISPPLVRQQSSKGGSRPVSREPGTRGDGEGLSAVPSCPGRLADAYDVQKPVGKGGYAVVYKGIRREDGRVVAVKKVEIFEMSAKKRERCLQEVTLLQQLDHPNIIQMLDAFIDENMLIIIFEWAPAGDLKRLIKKTAEQGKKLDEPSIWTLFYQVTDGLRYMHQHRIMHRDIKPANVLVGANGALKLGDLGLGRQLSEQTMEAFSKVGTPYYVSPEVVRGAGYDWKSDVWSMGCLLYELACLRSPFEMEGANLYDVFQKISKGEYSPLPAEQFSAPLRSLVGRMLQIDPAKRPELEEVWNITSSAVQSQSRTRSDVHSTAAELYEQLVLLSSEVTARLRGKAPPTTPPNGRRASSSSAGGTSATGGPAATSGIMVPPPMDTIRSLHPLYFAEPLVPPLRSDAGAFQKQQLGAFLHVLAWLLRLNGKSDAAGGVEAQLEFVPSARAPTAGRAGGTAAALAPASRQVALCINVLKGAEAAKRGAQVMGLNTEFAPVSAIALGHGRAVCGLLQDALALSVQRVPLAVRPMQRPPEPPAEEVPDEADGGLEGAAESVLTAGTPGTGPGYDTDGDGEEAEYMGATAATDRARDSLALGVASTSGGGVAGRSGERDQRRRGVQAVQTTRVDPVAWRQELERLAPQLGRIKISAAAAAGDWSQRWHQTKELLAALVAATPDTNASLGRLGAAVSRDLERIETTERRLNDSTTGLMQQYAASRRRLADMQRARWQHDELLEIGHSALAQLSERIEEVQQAIQDKTDGLDGSRQIKLIHDAMRTMRKEMRRMDIRIGIVRNELWAKQARRDLRLGAGILEEGEDEDEVFR